jgi:hypothetical protein
METIQIYTQAAENWVRGWKSRDVDGHLVFLIRSVLLHRDGKLSSPGGFVEAVVENDLAAAVGRADSDALKNLDIIVGAREFCHPA